MKKKTTVYVDALNLYYGALKETPYKWLDLSKFCEFLLPKNDVQHIHYFTAVVKPRPQKPHSQKLIRQETYLRALRTIPNLTITYGHFLTHEVEMSLVNPQPGQPPVVTVWKTEEKGSDVNLASRLIRDGHRDCYEVAVIISNNSDLLLAVRIVREELGKVVGIANPHKERPSKVLRHNGDFRKRIGQSVLRASQFPTTLTDAKGVFRKPQTW